MTKEINIYESKFGNLNLGNGPDNEFIWSGYVNEIPIYIFTKNRIISNETIEFVEAVVLNIDQYLETAILYIKETLTEKREKYNIKESEYDLLVLDPDLFPIAMPEFTFWEDSVEWMIRFADGKFNICDPLGIGITFRFRKPISVDNLEESEWID
ncbi:hypothetical protein [Flavobacterium sp. MMS24-S5]|uniref:hypothetical protein n=1 Tax=Flavobacterium sp. MMS24-S5 TaxID=3416605 RepID=UPI003CFD1A6D